ncbi:MAG: PLDc N-terminal domain-containing protein [Candidatus Kerfeldbacteria bacterium]|nr:PLDc N-terminal domain-containing protein [Candidatus Kerfeldbacteria bacterium]
MIFAFFAGLIGLVCFVFTIWMIIDAAKRNFDQKVLWILLMVFLGFIPAVIYYFMIKRKNVTGAGKSAAATVTPPKQ